MSWLNNKSIYIRFNKIIKLCNFSHGMKVLDVGCRELQLKKYIPSYVDYKAVDLEPKHKSVIKLDLNKEKLPFKDKVFDYVFCLEVLEHINSPYDVLSELKRVSRKWIIVSVPNPYHYRDLGKHLFKMKEKQGHINSFIYPNIWRQCENLGLKIIKIKGSFFLPFIPSNNLLLTRHLIYLLECIDY